MNAYRFSIEWAKCEPQEGKWDEAAFAWYENLLTECEKRNVMPMLTLQHFVLPQWIAARGGWADEGNVQFYARFVREVAKRLGARVRLWCTINEPMVSVVGGYLGGFMPPGKRDPKLLVRASRNMHHGHVLAYDILHKELPEGAGPWKDFPVRVGIAHNMIDFMPDRWWHPLELVFAKAISTFYNSAWLEAIMGKRSSFGFKGIVPRMELVPGTARKTADFLGVNYYTKAYIKWRPRDSSPGTLPNFPLAIAFARRNEEKSDLGWAYHPQGFRKVLLQAAKYGMPVYITENGIADRDDRLRAKYVTAHLREVAQLIAEGVDIRGYFHWSLMDNFEWSEGFGPRFGLFKVDYKDFHREIRPSAQMLQRIIAAHEKGAAPAVDLIDTHGHPG
jgi:beta-glucosidase